MKRSQLLQTGIIMTILVCLSLFLSLKTDSYDEKYSGYLLDNSLLQELGEKLFFDTNLSDPVGQSCAACHGAEVGWTGPDEQINKTGSVYMGAISNRFGNRKPTSSAYATYSPLFHLFTKNDKVHFAGGNLWDGRATGFRLGNPAADQAQGPLLNPVEQNIVEVKTLVNKVSNSKYSSLFRKAASEIWHIDDIFQNADTNLQYGIIGIALAAFEHSAKVNQFSSKYDYYLKGKVALSSLEQRGLDLFMGKGKCATCHSTEEGPDSRPPIFTDFGYANLGIPKNPLNPWYSMDKTFNREGKGWIDPGLGGFLMELPHYAMFAKENLGKHKIPTLRNVDKRPRKDFVKAFGHNGYFKSLEELVHFYNTRDILPYSEETSDPKPGINCWPKPEVMENISKTLTGNLKLSHDEELALVAFMKTLSDGFIPGKGEK